MLKEYFAMEITESGELTSIPLLLKGYMPSLGKLPSFVLRLGPNVIRAPPIFPLQGCNMILFSPGCMNLTYVPKVDWNSELECFDTLLRELALFYIPEVLPKSPPGSESPPAAAVADTNGKDTENSSRSDYSGWDDVAVATRRGELKRAVEAVIFPAMKKRLIAPKTLLGSVTEVANLRGLYRIFERSC